MDLIRKFLNSGSERSVRYKKNTLYMLFLKGISLGISLIYVPLLLNALDTENYGIWLTLTSIVSWVAMLDIGLGNGLRNKLANSLANNDILLAKKYVSSAYGVLSVYITLFVFVFLFFASSFLSWNSILNAPNIPPIELNTLVVVVFVSFGAYFILNLLNSILLALQSPALSSLISTIGQLVSLMAVFVCVKVFDINSLLVLGSIVSLAPVLVLIIASLILFGGKYSFISPNPKYYDKSLIRDVLKLGLNFFIIQLMTIFLYQSNNIIITHIAGNQSVVEYNIAYKYMQILYMLYIIIVTPMWSATTHAYASKDYVWIKNANRKLNVIAGIFAGIGLLMFIVSPFVYKLWLNNDGVVISVWTTFLLFMTEIFRMLYGNYGYIINGIGKLHAQLVIVICMGIVYIPMTIFAGKMFGLIGVLVMNLLVNLINFIWSKYQFSVLMADKPSRFWNR